MPMIMTASPATFTATGYEMLLLDPNRIERTESPKTLAEAKTLFEAFTASIPAGSWVVGALWAGRDTAPRGFKVARERNEFRHEIRPAAIAA